MPQPWIVSRFGRPVLRALYAIGFAESGRAGSAGSGVLGCRPRLQGLNGREHEPVSYAARAASPTTIDIGMWAGRT
jgi:hypothetical protein